MNTTNTESNTTTYAKKVVVTSYIKEKKHEVTKELLHAKVNPTLVLCAPIVDGEVYAELGKQAYLFALKTIGMAKQSAAASAALKLGKEMPYGRTDASASEYMKELLESIGMKEVQEFFAFERAERVTAKGLITYLESCYPAMCELAYFKTSLARKAILKDWLALGVDLPLAKKAQVIQWLNDTNVELNADYMTLYNYIPEIEELQDMP